MTEDKTLACSNYCPPKCEAPTPMSSCLSSSRTHPALVYVSCTQAIEFIASIDLSMFVLSLACPRSRPRVSHGMSFQFDFTSRFPRCGRPSSLIFCALYVDLLSVAPLGSMCHTMLAYTLHLSFFDHFFVFTSPSSLRMSHALPWAPFQLSTFHAISYPVAHHLATSPIACLPMHASPSTPRIASSCRAV